MDGGAFGAGKAGGAFDPHAFIRQPQTLLRLLSWVRGPSPTGGGLPPAAGLRRGGTDGRTDSHRQRERAAGSLRGGCRDLGGTGGRGGGSSVRKGCVLSVRYMGWYVFIIIACFVRACGCTVYTDAYVRWSLSAPPEPHTQIYTCMPP